MASPPANGGTLPPGRAFLGRGWTFPVRVGPTGALTYSEAEQDVAEAIWVILATAPGERQMLPQFGCGIHAYVFAPLNTATRTAIIHHVRDALVQWEPRIDVIDVRADVSPEVSSLLLIRVDYRVRSTNAFQNLVYPFYVSEGPGV